MAETREPAPAAAAEISVKDTEMPLVSPANAPEIHVDGFHGAIQGGGAVKINFFSARYNSETEKGEKHIVLTLATTQHGLVVISKALALLVEQWRKDGAIKSE